MFENFYKEIQQKVQSLGFTIIDADLHRPWGGFYYIDENQAQEFSNHFFNGIDVRTLKIDGKLSPKILMIKPQVKLSWQYHNRRAEIWQVYQGKVGVVQSETDEETEMNVYAIGSQLKLNQGVRHRLVGLDDYAVVAEIWQHTDKIPSDEEDIIRVQDDFGR